MIEARGSLECYSIIMPSVSVMLRKIEEKNQKNMSAHRTPRSKIMEASVILKIVEDAFYNCFFIIYVIISNNDSKMQAVLKHPSKGAQGQVLKSSKGKLDEETPEPSLLADPYHRMKVLSKRIYSVVNKIRSQGCGCTMSTK